MNKRKRRARVRLALATALAGVQCAARGGTFTWNGSASSSWDVSANWTPQGGGTVPQSNSTVLFPTPVPGTHGSSISLSNGEVSSTLSFSDNYLLSGGTLSVAAGTISVGSGKTATIGTVLTTSSLTGLSIGGGGVVELVHSNNTYSGDWNVQSGTLRIDVGTATSGGTSAIPIASGAALEINNVTWGRALTLQNGATLRGVGNAVYASTATVASTASVTLASGTISTDQLSNNISGSSIAGGSGATIHVAGAGTVQLLQASTYLGNWSVDSGTLQVSTANNTGTGTSAIAVNNTGVLQLTAGTTFSRDVTLNNGSKLSTSAISGYSGNIAIGSAAAVTFALGSTGTDQLSLSHILTGGSAGSSITTSGDGTLVLPFGASSFTGDWNVGGTTNLLVGDDSNLGNAANNVTLNGGTLSVYSSTTARQVTLGSAGGTIFVQSGNIFTMNGNVTANANPLALTGLGTLALFDTTARTGSTAIQNGIAELHTATALGSGSITLSQGGTLSLVSTSVNQPLSIANATLQCSGTCTYTGTITVGGAPVVFATGASPSDLLSLNGGTNSLTGGSTSINIAGSGTVKLNNASNFLGSWSVNSGTLSFDDDSEFGISSNGVTINGGTLFCANNVTSSRTFTMGASGGTISTSGAFFTINSALGANANSLTKTGLGTVALTTASTRTGSTLINQGGLTVSDGAALGSGAVNVTALGGNSGYFEVNGVTVNQPFNFVDNSGNSGILSGLGTSAYTGTINVAGGTLATITAGAGALFTIGDAANDLTGGTTSSVINLTPSGVVYLPFANNYVGNWNLYGGTLRVGNAGSIGSGNFQCFGGVFEIHGVNLARAVTLFANATVEGTGSARVGQLDVNTGSVTVGTGSTSSDVLRVDAITGISSSAVIVNGSGTVLLPSADNSYAGSWTIDNSTLSIQNSLALGSSTSTVIVGGGGSLALGNNVTVDRPIFLANGSAIGVVDSYGNIAGAVGTVSIPSAATVTFDVGTHPFIDLTIGDAPNELTGGGAGSTIDVIGSAGSVELRQPNNYSGTWAISGGAQVNINADADLGNASNPIILADLSSVGVNFGSGAIVTTRNITSTNGILGVGGGGSSLTLNGSLTASGTLDLRGDGNLTINGPQSWAPGSMLNTIGGVGIMQLNTDAGSAVSRNLTINAQFAPITLNSTQHLAGFIFGSGSGSGRSILTAGGNKVIVLSTIVNQGFTSPAQLDLTDNKLIVVGGTLGVWNGTKYTGITGMIKAGRNTGNWNGDGIITSMTAAGAASRLTTLAVAAAGDVGYGGTKTFGGQTVAAADVLVMYTYAGDANLNGAITGDDYARIDSGFAAVGSGYENGDFNYDGKINADDYFLIDRNYSRQGMAFSVAPGLSGVTAVPEPCLAGVLGLCFSGMLVRRSRRI